MPINGEVHGEVGFSSNSSLNQISLYRELFRPLSTNEAKDFFYIPFFIKVRAFSSGVSNAKYLAFNTPNIKKPLSSML